MGTVVVTQGLNTFLDKLEDVQTVDAGHELLTQTFADMGFDQFAYLGLHLRDTSLADPVLVHSFHDEWIERYISHNYAAIDPVVETGLASVVPFCWGGNERRKTMAAESRKMMDEATEFGLVQGLTIPIHGAGGELAVLSVTMSETPHEAQKRVAAHSHDIHLIALHFHAKLSEKIFALQQNKKLSLSHRESECLLWAAQGKTAWETGEILKISENTVREYIKNACQKLGVYSKNHAIVKSIMLGLIKPNL